MEPIRFAVQAPADDLTGLARTLSLLRGINAYLVSINTGFAGLRQVTLPERSIEDFAGQIKQLADKLTPTAFVRGTKATALVDQLLGPEARAAFERQLEAFKRRFKDAFRGETFSDPGSAAKVARAVNEQVRNDQFRDARRLRRMLSDAAENGMATQPRLVPAGTAGPVAATIGDGSIGLSVGVDRISVVLGPGPIHLTVPADRIQAAVGGTVTRPQTVAELAAGSGGPPASSPAPGSAQPIRRTPSNSNVTLDDQGLAIGADLETDPTELQRRIRRSAKSARTSITRAVNDWVKITETFDEQGELIGSDEVRARAKGASQFIRQSIAEASRVASAEDYASTALPPVAQLRQRAAILRRQTQAIQQAVEAEADILTQTGQSTLLTQMRAKGWRDMATSARMEQRANNLEQQQRRTSTRETLAAVGRGVRDEAAAQRRRDTEDRTLVRESTRTRRERARIEAAAERARQEAAQRAAEAFGENQSATAAALSAQAGRTRANELLDPASGYRRSRRTTNDAFRRTQGFSGVETMVFERDDAGMRYIETIKIARRQGEDFAASVERTERALRATRREAGAAGRNFVQNTQQVTSWAASVGALYGALGLLRAGVRSFIETSYQTQRLGVVFSGIGGNARDLSRDVTQLAVANGRSTDEALESAIAWSRLGLTRRQVNEAVRISLMAANVAEISATEATENLQGVYQSYRLEVGNLSATLAQLNEVSNTTNATVGELFEGLSRVAPAAAQAGVPLRTLVGFLGQMIAQTKQSGANLGNALKTFVGRLSTPDMLRQIRDDFGVQINDETGNQKDFLGVLDAVYERYQKLTTAEQNALLVRVAGNTQLNRMAALMDGYIRAQVLAINTQLRLNSAESENEIIRQTLRNQLQGLVSEMQRFAMMQGSNGPFQAMGAFAETLRNVLAVMNAPGVNVAFTSLITVLGVVGARAVIARSRMMALAGTPGYLARSFTAARGVVNQMSAELTNLAYTVMQTGRRVSLADRVGRGRRNTNDGIGLIGTAGLMSLGGARGAGLAVVGTLQRALTALFATFGRFLGWIGILGGAIYAFNKGMEWLGRSSSSADAQIGELTKSLEAADAKANAASDSIRLLDTVLRLLPSASADARKQILQDLSQLPEGIAMSMTEIQQGMADPLAAVSAVQSARERAYLAQVTAQQESFMRAQAVVQRIESELKRLQSARSPDSELIDQKATELEQARSRSIQQRARVKEAIDSDAGDGDTGDEARRKYAEIIDARAAIVRSILNDSALDGPVQRLRAQMEAEKAIINGLRQSQTGDEDARRRAYNRSEDLRREADAIREQAQDYRRRAAAKEITFDVADPFSMVDTPFEKLATDLEARSAEILARTQSPELRQLDARLEVTGSKIREADAKLKQLESLTNLTAAQDSIERAKRSAGQSLVPYAYGRSETETIQRQLAAAERMLAESGRGPASLDELGRREGLLLEVGRLREDQVRREADLQREINALIEQRTREFERQIALASPAELLRTLAAIQTAREGLTAGQFLAAGDLRQRILELPGFGDQERGLSREASILNRLKAQQRPTSTDADLAEVQGLIGRRLAGIQSRSNEDQPTTLAAAAGAGAKELGVFASAVTAGASAIHRLTAAVGTLESKIGAVVARVDRAMPTSIVNPQAAGNAGGFAR